MGQDWTILLEVPESDKWGMTSFRTQTMKINPNISQQNREITFLHELLHLATWSTGIDKILDDDTEEKVVNSISSGLYAMLQEGIIKC